MRIGILGGTFDPIHEGHLALARAAVKELRLDKLVFIPTYRHPLNDKQNSTVTNAEDRLQMVRLAIGGESKFEVSDLELNRKGISYTVDTLNQIRQKFPKPHEVFFVTGGDWGKNLNQWKDIDTIFSLAHFVVAKRPGFDTRNLPKEVTFLDFTPLDISSTKLRAQLEKDVSSVSLVPKPVLDYIRCHQLYRS